MNLRRPHGQIVHAVVEVEGLRDAFESGYLAVGYEVELVASQEPGPISKTMTAESSLDSVSSSS